MANTTATVDFTTVSDPDTRRALRGLVQLSQQLSDRIAQQQQEIEALLQMMLEKHIGSMSEFRHHMARAQSGEARSERLHGQVSSMAARPAAPAVPSLQTGSRPPAQEYSQPEIDRPRRYTL